jgi:peptidoglycan/LPS O-acetylase OafA/YrhL
LSDVPPIRPAAQGSPDQAGSAILPPGAIEESTPGESGPTEEPGAGSPYQFRLGNRPPLTGLRFCVLLGVLIYHSNFRSLPGAWSGLQVFFVLSGFLITAMLASEGRRKGRISLSNFYTRRAARLVPPLLLTAALLAVYAAFVHVADASQRIWGDSLAAMFYYADYRQAFGHAPFFGYLAQTWSLSVEEQFYIIWSVLMVVAVAAQRRRLAYAFAIAGIALSVADRLWIVFRAPHFNAVAFSRAYYAFDSRADALFIGCLLGLLAVDGYLHGWKRWPTRLLSVSAAAAAALLVWILVSTHLFTESVAAWWLPVSAVAAAVAIAYLVISPQGIGSRFAGLGFFVFVGNLSYTV